MPTPTETITELLSIIKTQQPEIWDDFVNGVVDPPNPPQPPIVSKEPVLPLADVNNMGGKLIISTPGNYVLSKDIVSQDWGIIVTCSNVTIDGNGHVIIFNSLNKPNINGIHVCTADWAAEDQILPADIRKLIKSPVENVTIKNVCLRHTAKSKQSHGIGGRQSNNVVIDNCIIEVAGEDSQTISFKWGKLTIQNSLLIVRDQTTADRHLGPCNVGSQALNASGNILYGGNSGFKCDNGNYIEIKNNFIFHNGYVTNPYGVWLYNCSDVFVQENYIFPINGRGVLVNDGKRISISNNNILALELPNNEFGINLNACGIRVRYNIDSLFILDNDILSIGGSKYCSSSALYLTLHQNTANINIEGNDLSSIILNTQQLVDSKSITFEGSQNGNCSITNNIIQSNQYLFGLSGYDGPGVISDKSIINENHYGVIDSVNDVYNELYEYPTPNINGLWAELKLDYINYLWFKTVDEIYNILEVSNLNKSTYMFYSGYTSGNEQLIVGDKDIVDNKLIRSDGWPSIYVNNVALPGTRKIQFGNKIWQRFDLGPYQQVTV